MSTFKIVFLIRSRVVYILRDHLAGLHTLLRRRSQSQSDRVTNRLSASVRVKGLRLLWRTRRSAPPAGAFGAAPPQELLQSQNVAKQTLIYSGPRRWIWRAPPLITPSQISFKLLSILSQPKHFFKTSPNSFSHYAAHKNMIYRFQLPTKTILLTTLPFSLLQVDTSLQFIVL
jgi:hypothetical protein